MLEEALKSTGGNMMGNEGAGRGEQGPGWL